MNRIIIATIKSWNIENAEVFQKQFKNTLIITHFQQLNYNFLKRYKPTHIFFPHWSWRIPKNIYLNFNCIAFHMTDLPFGRGGSPLQNLIIQGYTKTKISAFKIIKELDAGPVYIKKDLSLNGTAYDIFKRASRIIFTRMIPYIIKHNPSSHKQIGKIVTFQRLQPARSNISKLKNTKEIYNYIRMLDAPEYTFCSSRNRGKK